MKENKIIEWFIIFYIILFAIISILQKNYEFFYYCIIYLLLIIIIKIYVYKHKIEIKLSKIILLGFALLGIAHFLGAVIHINGVRLYDTYFILKYDNYIHAFGTFLLTFVIYDYFSPYLSPDFKKSMLKLGFLVVVFTLGIGSIIEIIEFFGIIFFKASGVGDYTNNALDQIFNITGALTATIIIYWHEQKNKSKQ